jgi:hypothetical protein
LVITVSFFVYTPFVITVSFFVYTPLVITVSFFVNKEANRNDQ